MTSPTVLLTGASGFIALHITDLLLQKGFKVIGTVRSQSKADKLIDQFKQLHPNGELSYAIVEDISIDSAFDKVLKENKEITKILHTASPFSFGLDKPFDEAYLTPAVNGTRNILVATKKLAPQVDTVVITSSFASIMNVPKAADRNFVHTEETWNPIEWKDVTNEFEAYFASKKLAEVEGWKFIEEEKPNFKLTTVNPPYVFGIQLFDDVLSNPSLNTSADFVNKALSTPLDSTDFLSEPAGLAVDVKDVAFLHVKALEDSNLAGKRLFPSGGLFFFQTIVDIILRNFPELKSKVGAGAGDEALTKKLEIEKLPIADTSATLKLTGRDSWISVEDQVVSATKQILEYRKKNGIEF